MKAVFLSALLIGCMTFGCNSNDKNEDAHSDSMNQMDEGSGEVSMDGISVKRYTVKSGIIKYSISGDQTGTEELYFDDWGMKEAKYTTTTMIIGGVEQNTNKLEILDGDFAYTIDLDKKTGTKMINPIAAFMNADSDEMDFIEYGKKMLRDMGGVNIGTDEVLGKACDVWEMKDYGTKTWVWNAITMKLAISKGFKMTTVATSIDENVAVPDSKFAIPDGVTITEL